MGFNKQNDWVAVMLNVENNDNIQLGSNPNLTLYSNGITPDNTGIKDRDYYKNIPQIQKKFTDSNGKFDESAFNQFYTSATSTFQEFAEIDFAEQMLNEIGVSPYDSSRLSNPKRKVQNISAILTPFHDKNRTTYGTANLWETGSATFSDREVAQANYVRDENGNVLDWTPNDRSGFKSFFTPALAYASYDEDVFDENGKLIHQKGELKLDENGDPYTELLGNREAFAKDIVKWSDTFSVEGSVFNKLDVFDSDGLDKSTWKVIGQTALMIAPYFTPIGAYWGWANAVGGLMTALPSLVKSLDGLFTGNADDSGLAKSMNKLENIMGRFKPTTSDASKGKFWSAENLGDLIVSSSAQLYSQRNIANALAKWAPFKSKQSNDLLARSVSTGYMAMTSASDSYASFKEAGASDAVAGAGTLLTMAGFYTLLQQGYFKEKLFEGSLLDEDQRLIHNVKKMSQYAVDKTFANPASTDKKEITKWTGQAWNWLKNQLHNMPKGLAYETNTFMSRSINEGIEETMEEVLQDTVKGLTKGLEAIGIDCTEGSDNLNYNWDLKSALTRYGTSFVGGALGGAVFEAYNLRELYKDPNYRKLLGASPIRRMYADIAQGRAEDYRKAIIARGEKKKNGNANLSATYDTPDGVNGPKVYRSGTAENNQNDAVTNELLRMVDVAEAIYARHNLIYSNEELLKTILETDAMKEHLKEKGMSESEFKEKGKILSAYGATDSSDADAIIDALFEATIESDGKKIKVIDAIAESVLVDVNEIRNKIAEIETEINAKLNEYPETEPHSSDEDRKRLIKSNSYLKKLEEQKQTLLKQFEEIISGKQADLYLAQTLMFLDSRLLNTYFGFGNDIDNNSIRNIQNFARFKYGIDNFDELTDEGLKEFIISDYDDFLNNRASVLRNVATMHLDLSEKLQSQLQEVEDFLHDATESTKYLFNEQRMTIESAIAALNDERAKVEKRLVELVNAGVDESDDKFKDVLLRIAAIKRNLNYFETLPKEMRFDDWFDYNLSGKNNDEANFQKQEYIKKFYSESVSKKAVYVKDDLLKAYLRNYDFNYIITNLDALADTLANMNISVEAIVSAFADVDYQLNEAQISALRDLIVNGELNEESIADLLDVDIDSVADIMSNIVSIFQGDLLNQIKTKLNTIISTLRTNPTQVQDAIDDLINLLNSKDASGNSYIQWDSFKTVENNDELKKVKDAESFIEYLFNPAGSNNILDFVQNVTKTMEGLPESPIFDLLQHVSQQLTGQPSRIFEILRREKANVKLQRYEGYLMSESARKEIYDAEGIINVLEGLLTGSMYGNLNEILNSKRENPFTILTPNTVEILKREFGFVKDQFKALKNVSEINQGNKLAENTNIAKVDSVKRFMAFVNPSQGSWIKELEDKLSAKGWRSADGKKFTSFKDMAKNHDYVVEDVPNWTEEQFSQFYLTEAEFRENLNIWFSGLRDEEQQEVIKLIASLDAESLKITNMSEDEFSSDTEHPAGAWGNIRYLLSNLTTSNAEFQGLLEKSLETSKFLPFYNQEFCIRDAYASFVAKDLYNLFTEELRKKLKTSSADSADKYISAIEAIKNFFFIDGAPGTGKSSAVTALYIKVLQNKYGSKLKVVAMVQDSSRKEAFGDEIGIPAGEIHVASEFIDQYVYSGIGDGGKRITAEDDPRFQHSEFKIKNSNVKKIETFGSKADKFLFVCDEATFINEPQIIAFNRWLAQYTDGKSAFLLGLGDFYQSGSSSDDLTDITDAYFPISVRLTSALRYENNGKSNNENLVRGTIKNAVNQWRNDRGITIEKISTDLYKSLSALNEQLIGYYDPETGAVYGDIQKQTSEIPTVIDNLIKSYPEGKTPSICIITNNSDEYNSYIKPGVEVRTPAQAQGGQWDYVISDIDFTFKETDAFLTARLFYTIMTRAKKGTVWTGPIANGFRFESSVDAKRAVGQDLKSDEATTNYKNWRKKLFSITPKSITGDSNGDDDNDDSDDNDDDSDDDNDRDDHDDEGGQASPENAFAQEIDKMYSIPTDEEIEEIISKYYSPDATSEEATLFAKKHREHVENYRERVRLVNNNEAIDYDSWENWIKDDNNLMDQCPFNPNIDKEEYRGYLRYVYEVISECLSTKDQNVITQLADKLETRYEDTLFADINKILVNHIKSQQGEFYLRNIGFADNGLPMSIVYYRCGNKMIPIFAARSSTSGVSYKWNDVHTEFKIKPIQISSNGTKFVPFDKMSKKVAISERIVIFKGFNKDEKKLTESQQKFQKNNKGKAFILVSKITDDSVKQKWNSYLQVQYNENDEVSSFVDNGNLYVSLSGVQRICTPENFKTILDIIVKASAFKYKPANKNDEDTYEELMTQLEKLIGRRVDIARTVRNEKGTLNPDHIFSASVTDYLLNLFIHNTELNVESETGLNIFSRINKSDCTLDLELLDDDGNVTSFSIVNLDGKLYIIKDPDTADFTQRSANLIPLPDDMKLENKGFIVKSFVDLFARAIHHAYNQSGNVFEFLGLSKDSTLDDVKSKLEAKVNEETKSGRYKNKFSTSYIFETKEGLKMKMQHGIADKLFDIAQSDQRMKDKLLAMATYFSHGVDFNIFATEFDENGVWGIADSEYLNGFGTDVVDVLPSTYGISFVGTGEPKFYFAEKDDKGSINKSSAKYDVDDTGSIYTFKNGNEIVVDDEWVANYCYHAEKAEGVWKISKISRSGSTVEIELVDSNGKMLKTSLKNSYDIDIIMSGVSENRYSDGDITIKDGIIYQNGLPSRILGFTHKTDLNRWAVIVSNVNGISQSVINDYTKSLLEQDSRLKGYEIDLIKTDTTAGVLSAIGVNSEGFWLIEELDSSTTIPKITKILDNEVNVSEQSVKGIKIDNFDEIRTKYKLDSIKSAFTNMWNKEKHGMQSDNEELLKSVINEIDILMRSNMPVSDIQKEANKILENNAFKLGVLYKLTSSSLAFSKDRKYSLGPKIYDLLPNNLTITDINITKSPKIVVSLENDMGDLSEKTYIHDGASGTIVESKFDKDNCMLFIESVLADDVIKAGLSEIYDEEELNRLMNSTEIKDIKQLLGAISSLYENDDDPNVKQIEKLIETLNNC